MAEKKVSVRLVAEGGRRVRAELEGVGEAGARGFGRLSREMELANTRLAAFARRAGLALGAAAAAATASLGLIVRSTAESAAQIRQFAQVANATPEALQRWSAGARTVGIEQEKLADILKDVNDRVGDFLQTGGGPMADFFESVAPRVGVTADQFARLSDPEALQLYVDTLERAGLSQQEMTFYLEAMASDATRLLPLLRNGGAEMARLGDQASDLGAVLDSDALEALRRTQLALGTVSLVFDGLRNRIAVAVAPTIEALANAFVALASDGGILRSAIDGLIGNLGRLASYAATFAAVMAGRWVAGMAAAAVSVRGLATALAFLRGALIRTGIGALIVGAGELVYQFSQLVARVGGVGEAFRLLGDLAREVWSRIGLSLDAALARMAAGWEGLKAAGLSALEGTIAGVVSFGDRTAAIFQGAYDAAVAIWGSLPGAISDFAFQAANGLISGVEAMLNGVVTRINSFIETLNAALALLPEWATGEGGVRIGILDPVELGRIGNPFEGAATAAGAAAADAFSAALSRTYLEPPDLGLGTMADDARARANGYREAAGMLADAAGRPLASWQALKDAVTGTGTEAETALADAAASADALTSGLNDTANRLSINTPAVLLNNAGAGIETTVNKAAAGNDAAFAFKTGFSARALIGLLGSDDFSFKVSPDGSAFFDAIRIDRTSGQVELPQPTVLPGLAAAPTPPPAGKAAVYARSRAGAPWIDVMRPSGRDFPLQPHFGVNRIATWSPSVTTTITTEGMPITSVGTVSHPTLAATNLAASMRRWRLTSAAVVDSVADQRSAGWACWRGNAAGLGGWTFVTRISLTTLQATGMGFFGLYGSTAALATTLTLAATINCIGIGFQRGTHTRWQLVTNDGTGAPTLTDMGASFGIATGGVLTLFIAAPPNGSSVWVRVVDEVSGAVFEQEITADLPAATQFLSPRLFLNTGATAAAVAYDCAGVYLETDF